MTNTDKPRNICRTWKIEVYGGWGDGASAVVKLGETTLTVTADNDGNVTAEMNGQPQPDVAAAYALWKEAKAAGRLTLLDEQHLTPPPAPLAFEEAVIGKARARVLHKIMGMAGLPGAQHYAISAAALCEPWPLETLSTLTEAEAKTVWAHLCRVYPAAREAAAQLGLGARRTVAA
jgi:hypothetical protein